MGINEREERALVLQMWSQNVSEEMIAKIIEIGEKQVHEYISIKSVNLAGISNMEEAAREMQVQGKTEDEIAGILGVDVRTVRAFLEGRRDDRR